MDNIQSGQYTKWTIYKVDNIQSGQYIKWTIYKVDNIQSGQYTKWTIYKVNLVTVIKDHHKYLEPQSTLVAQFQNSHWLNNTCFEMIMHTLLVAL